MIFHAPFISGMIIIIMCFLLRAAGFSEWERLWDVSRCALVNIKSTIVHWRCRLEDWRWSMITAHSMPNQTVFFYFFYLYYNLLLRYLRIQDFKNFSFYCLFVFLFSFYVMLFERVTFVFFWTPVLQLCNPGFWFLKSHVPSFLEVYGEKKS